MHRKTNKNTGKPKDEMLCG